jgi:restriction system protein
MQFQPSTYPVTYPVGEEHFIGREMELREMGRLVDGKSFHDIVIKIVGPAGSGKTALARHFVRQHEGLFESAWINLRDSSISPEIFVRSFLDERDKSRRRRRAETYKRLLVVLDGVDEVKAPPLDQWVRTLMNLKATGGIVITSRNVIPLPGHDIYLGPLDEAEAKIFLAHRLKQPYTADQLAEMAKLAAGNPLALSLFGTLGNAHSVPDLLRGLNGKSYELNAQQGRQIIQAVGPQLITFSGTLIERLKLRPDALYEITPRQFEEVIADIFDGFGWEVKLTQATRDGGRDILAHVNTGTLKMLCLIEAKKHRKDRPVGVQLVRNLYGTFCDEQANSAMLVTTSYFSPEAKKLQERHKYQLSLKDYADVVDWILKYKMPGSGFH